MSGQIHKCSRCGEVGHNVRRCKRAPAPEPTRCSFCGQPDHNKRSCVEAAADRRAIAAIVPGLGPGAGATKVPAITVDRARADRFAAIEAARLRREREA